MCPLSPAACLSAPPWCGLPRAGVGVPNAFGVSPTALCPNGVEQDWGSACPEHPRGMMSCGPEDLELSVLGWQELGRSYPNNGDAWSPQWRSKAGGVRRFVRRVAAHSRDVGLQMP